MLKGFAMLKKCLVISANNNIKTFKATLLAIKRYYLEKQEYISSIVVIRTTDGENISNISNYKSECDSVFPMYEDYSEKKIESSSLYLTKLPIIFRELLSLWDPKNIVVDLTNGTKSYTDFVYLACTLLDIQSIFRISISREYYNDPNASTDYLCLNMESVLSQDQIRSFVNKTYAEYIYYYSEVKELSDWFKRLLGEHMSVYFFKQMLNSFEKYAVGEYRECIVNLSTMTEELLKHVFAKLEACFDNITWDWLNGKGIFDRSNGNNRNKMVTLGSLAFDLGTILTRADKIISNNQDKATQAYDEKVSERNGNIYKLAPVVAVGHALQSITLIRNYSAHGSKYSKDNNTIHDARFQIDVILYVFHKMSECELLGGAE